MADSSDNSADLNGILIIRLFQTRLDAGPINGGEADELMRLSLELSETWITETHPALKRALARAQKLPLPREVLDELTATAADVKLYKDIELTNTAIGAMCAGADKAQILQRTIAAIERLGDEARTLTERIDRLIEESGSKSV